MAFRHNPPFLLPPLSHSVAFMLDRHSGLVSTKMELNPPTPLGSVLAPGDNDHGSHHYLIKSQAPELTFLEPSLLPDRWFIHFRTFLTEVVDCFPWQHVYYPILGHGGLCGLPRLSKGIILLQAISEAHVCPIQCSSEGHTFSPDFKVKNCALNSKFWNQETPSELLLFSALATFLGFSFWPQRAFPTLCEQKFL